MDVGDSGKSDFERGAEHHPDTEKQMELSLVFDEIKGNIVNTSGVSCHSAECECHWIKLTKHNHLTTINS